MTTGATLYLVSACGTAEEFVAAFRRYADRAGLFVPTSGPLPAGKRGRIAVTLRDGGVMIEGEAEILQSSPKPTVLQGRPGMTIKFVEPDEPSKVVIGELEKARLAMRPPPPTVPPRPATIPAEPRPVVPPVGGRIDAANALAECVVIGDPASLRDTSANRSGGAKPFAVPSIPATGVPSVPAIPPRPKTPTDAPREKPPTVPPPIPAYPTNTKMTSVGFPAIDKLPAGNAPAVPVTPAPTGNTGKVAAPVSSGNTGKVAAPVSSGNTGKVAAPVSSGNTGKVAAPASTGNTGKVAAPASTSNSGKVTAPASTSNSGKVGGATTLGMPAIDRKPDPSLLNTTPGVAAPLGMPAIDRRPDPSLLDTTPGVAAPPNPTQQMRAENPHMGVGVVKQSAPSADSEATAIGGAPAKKPMVSADDEATAVGVVVNKVRPASDDEATAFGEVPPKPAAAVATPEPPKPSPTPALGKNHRATSIGFPAMRTPFETQPVGVVQPPKEGEPSPPVIAKKPGMPIQPRGKTPTAPPPGPRYPTPAAPLPVVRPPAKSAVTDEEEKTDLSSIPLQPKAPAPAPAEEFPETPVPQFDPLAQSAPVTGRSGGMRASEIMAAIGGDDWTMTPDAPAPTVLEKPAAPEASQDSASGPIPKGPPTGNWTISLDPETGWSEPEKVATPAPAPAPAPVAKPKRPTAGNPNATVASGDKAINVVEWEEKPTGIGEAKIEIDSTLMEPLRVVPVEDHGSGRTSSSQEYPATQEYQPPPLPQPPAMPSHAFPASGMTQPSAHHSAMVPPAGMAQASSQFPTPAPAMFDAGAAAPAASKKRMILIAAGAGAVLLLVVIIALVTGGGGKKAKATAGSASAPPIAQPVVPADAAVTQEPAGSGEQIVEQAGSATETPKDVEPATGPCTVAVSSVPTGADVLLGKQKLGTTPGSFELPCGSESTLTLKKAKFLATPKSITPTAGKANKLVVKLNKTMFSMKVTSTPAGATITVGGKNAGVTPATVKVPGFEASTITISKPGFATDSSKVTAKANGQAHHVVLKKATRR